MIPGFLFGSTSVASVQTSAPVERLCILGLCLRVGVWGALQARTNAITLRSGHDNFSREREGKCAQAHLIRH
jgi:hypothetical protein